jgi:membrane associated rhomboid family serine protease
MTTLAAGWMRRVPAAWRARSRRLRRWTTLRRREIRLGAAHAAGALALGGGAGLLWPWGAWLLWPATALGLVAAGYLGMGAAVFGKCGGRPAPAARLVLGPYLAGAYLLRLRRRWQEPAWSEVASGLYLGRALGRVEAAALPLLGVGAVLDLSAECGAPATARGLRYRNLPLLEGMLPSVACLDEAAAFAAETWRPGVADGGLHVHGAGGGRRRAGGLHGGGAAAGGGLRGDAGRGGAAGGGPPAPRPAGRGRARAARRLVPAARAGPARPGARRRRPGLRVVAWAHGPGRAAGGPVFPYHDENRTQRLTLVTYLLVGANVLVWLGVQGAGATLPLARSVCELGLIPGELTLSVPPGTRFPMGEGLVCLTDPGRQLSNVLTSMFLHGSWMHLLGNMWFLYLFGNNVEDAMGGGRYLAFYLLSGLAAAALQVMTNPASAVPMVGASGAISGVMGGYLVLYPRVRVFTLVPLGFFLTSVALPAWLMLVYWLALQFLGGLASITREGGGVAFWAHVGGFVAGVALVKLFARPAYVAAHRERHWRPSHRRW